MVETRNRHAILCIVILNDLNIRVAVLVGRGDGAGGRYLVVALGIVFLIHVKLDQIARLVLNRYLICAKFADLALDARLQTRCVPLHLVILIAQVPHLLEVARVCWCITNVLELRVQLIGPIDILFLIRPRVHLSKSMMSLARLVHLGSAALLWCDGSHD